MKTRAQSSQINSPEINSIAFPLTSQGLLQELSNPQSPLYGLLFAKAERVAGAQFQPLEIWGEALNRLHSLETEATFASPKRLMGYWHVTLGFVKKDLVRKMQRRILQQPFETGEAEDLLYRQILQSRQTEEVEMIREALYRVIGACSEQSQELARVLLEHDCFKTTGTIHQGLAAGQLQTSQSTVNRMWGKLKREAAKAKALAQPSNQAPPGLA